MEKFNRLKELIAPIEADEQKFYERGNKAAITRFRKAFQQIKMLARQVRWEVGEIKNKRKV